MIYNSHITVRDVPEAAWEYVVNKATAEAGGRARRTGETAGSTASPGSASAMMLFEVASCSEQLDLPGFPRVDGFAESN